MEPGAIRIITLEMVCVDLFNIGQNISPVYQKKIDKFHSMQKSLLEAVAQEQGVSTCQVVNLSPYTTLQLSSFNLYNELIDEFCTLPE